MLSYQVLQTSFLLWSISTKGALKKLLLRGWGPGPPINKEFRVQLHVATAAHLKPVVTGIICTGDTWRKAKILMGDRSILCCVTLYWKCFLKKLILQQIHLRMIHWLAFLVKYCLICVFAYAHRECLKNLQKHESTHCIYIYDNERHIRYQHLPFQQVHILSERHKDIAGSINCIYRYIPDLYIEYTQNHDGSVQIYTTPLLFWSSILATIWTWGRCQRFLVPFLLPLYPCWITFKDGNIRFYSTRYGRLADVKISWSW